MLARIGGFVDRLDNILTVSSLQYSQQWWGRMSRSIWQICGHWATIIATDFEVPGITIPCLCFVGHACGSAPLIMLVVILIYYIIMACLFRTEIRWDSLVWFPILFHCTLEGRVRHFWAAMWSEILNFWLLVLTCLPYGLHQTIIRWTLGHK